MILVIILLHIAEYAVDTVDAVRPVPDQNTVCAFENVSSNYGMCRPACPYLVSHSPCKLLLEIAFKIICFHGSLSDLEHQLSAAVYKLHCSSGSEVTHQNIIRVFPTAGFELIDTTEFVEEETLPSYNAANYYPVRIGEVLNRRYQVLTKLGYGVTSTVWLCHDLSNSKYIALKVYVHGVEKNNELSVYDRTNSVETDHMGKLFMRKLLDHFHIEGPHGHHTCLVLQPLGITVEQFLCFCPGRVMTIDDLKPCLRQVLGVLDFLHTQAHIIHTDLQLKNLLLPGNDPKSFSDLEEAELKDPSPRKILDGREIYLSRMPIPGNGLPLLSDFGEARFSNEEHREDIMPNVYRAPEVVLKMNWDCKVDIWNVALMAWDMVCHRTLFQGRNSDDIFDDRAHLAEMMAILGPPAAEFVTKSPVGSVFWDENGRRKNLFSIPNALLDELAADIQGHNKKGFLQFMQRALKWDPEDRLTAWELMLDPWMMEGLELRKRG
ncbi:CMGC protein kinase [Paecilomyces variotii No. 5]|uniref:non-specific serine/threonine protein kinase n=1 Tax=Byssochlamys spectabilis (strain No. 5 / NBRC 109023) TaxID=1356009 RepID=V5FJP5_BYSSN|nr:CMGC protein kinase [Paecilomyces variotii No. 5]